MCCWTITMPLHTLSQNQLEKLEAAKAACLVCLSLLSLTGSFWVNFYWPYWALLWALLGPTGPYWALPSITGPYLALLSLT